VVRWAFLHSVADIHGNVLLISWVEARLQNGSRRLFLAVLSHARIIHRMRRTRHLERSALSVGLGREH